jgi:hypothetical protein
MTIYRVGRDGATAIGPDSQRTVWLPAGTVIVVGSDVPSLSEDDGATTLAGQTVEVIEKRVRHYPNKRLRSQENYSDKGGSSTPAGAPPLRGIPSP